MILHWYGIVDGDPMTGGVGRSRAVGDMASPDFGRSVNFLSGRMVECSLSRQEVPGSIPGASISILF